MTHTIVIHSSLEEAQIIVKKLLDMWDAFIGSKSCFDILRNLMTYKKFDKKYAQKLFDYRDIKCRACSQVAI